MTPENISHLTGTLIDCRLRQALIGLLSDVTLAVELLARFGRSPETPLVAGSSERTRFRKTHLSFVAVVSVCHDRLRMACQQNGLDDYDHIVNLTLDELLTKIRKIASDPAVHDVPSACFEIFQDLSAAALL
jgi:hypothetical protein